MTGFDRVICNDNHLFLIEMLIGVQLGYELPDSISKEQYDYIRTHKDEDHVLTGFVGFGCSFGGKWFGGYARNAGGTNYAKLMVLIGRGDGFQEKPFYEENLAFAEKLTEQLNALRQGICKDVLVKKNRYNQHAGIHSILIEVGNNQNTLEEALASMPILAEALDALLMPGEAAKPLQLAAEGA